MRAAVVGHVEWVDFVRVDRMPATGAIVHASGAWEEPAGGGAVAAVELASLAGSCTLFTALGDDERARRAREILSEHGVRIEATTRRAPQRRAVTLVDAAGERTIVVLGERLAASAEDPLPWRDLDTADVVYACAGDPAALRLARRARVLVATSRISKDLGEAAVELDAITGSGRDAAERWREGALEPAPRLVVRTDGERGGELGKPGEHFRRYAATALPGPVADSYGCGDRFAAALAFALAQGLAPDEAVAFAAARGARALTIRGALGTQKAAD